jgi:hypothetical protein
MGPPIPALPIRTCLPPDDITQGLERGWYERITNAEGTPGNPFPGSAFNVMWTSLGAVEKPGAYSTGLVRAAEGGGAGDDVGFGPDN